MDDQHKKPSPTCEYPGCTNPQTMTFGTDFTPVCDQHSGWHTRDETRAPSAITDCDDKAQPEQPCGHPTSAIRSSGEGTAFCAMCADKAALTGLAQPEQPSRWQAMKQREIKRRAELVQTLDTTATPTEDSYPAVEPDREPTPEETATDEAWRIAPVAQSESDEVARSVAPMNPLVGTATPEQVHAMSEKIKQTIQPEQHLPVCVCGHSYMGHEPLAVGSKRHTWCGVTDCACQQYQPEQPAHATDFRDSRNTKAQPEQPCECKPNMSGYTIHECQPEQPTKHCVHGNPVGFGTCVECRQHMAALQDQTTDPTCVTCGAALRGDGKCEASGMTPAVCGKHPFRVGGDQPAACQVLLSEDGNGYDAATCNTCGTVLGPWPQPQHSLPDCVRSLHERIEANRVN